jgi:hypothetical protein
MPRRVWLHNKSEAKRQPKSRSKQQQEPNRNLAQVAQVPQPRKKKQRAWMMLPQDLPNTILANSS